MRSSEHQTALLGIALVAPRAELDVPPPNSRGAFVNCHLCGIDWELSRAHTASLVLLVGVIATAVAFAVPLIDLLIDLSEWLIGYSFLTVFTVFTGTIVILTPLGAPFTAFAVLAGFMFRKKLGSLVGGVAVAVASMTLGYGGGSIVGFLIGRMLLRECAEGIAKQNKVLQALDGALGGEKGLRLNILLRLSPIVPYQALMYGLPMTRTSLFDFTAGFAAGGLPYSVTLAWLGALLQGVSSTSDLSDAAAPGSGSSPALAGLYVGGAVVSVTLVVTLQRAAKAEIDKQVALEDQERAAQEREVAAEDPSGS